MVCSCERITDIRQGRRKRVHGNGILERILVVYKVEATSLARSYLQWDHPVLDIALSIPQAGSVRRTDHLRRCPRWRRSLHKFLE